MTFLFGARADLFSEHELSILSKKCSEYEV